MQISSIQGSTASPASSRPRVSSMAYFDPKDANQDGIISPMEVYTYSLDHYDQNGALKPSGKIAIRSFDAYS